MLGFTQLISLILSLPCMKVFNLWFGAILALQLRAAMTQSRDTNTVTSSSNSIHEDDKGRRTTKSRDVASARVAEIGAGKLEAIGKPTRLHYWPRAYCAPRLTK